MRNVLTITLLMTASLASAAEMERNVATLVPNAEKVGGGRMTYLMWDVYDATLYAPAGHYSPDAPFALQLRYLRDLTGKDIARRSVEEMRQQGFHDEVKLAAWYAEMENIFPNVSKGTVLTGIRTAQGETVFEMGDKEIGRIPNAEFTRQFFDIWLSGKTTAPELRTALIGPQ